MKILRFFVLMVVTVAVFNADTFQRTTRSDVARLWNCPKVGYVVSKEHHIEIREALMSNRFASLGALLEVLEIEYSFNRTIAGNKRPMVNLSHCSAGRRVSSIVESGVNEDDFRDARDKGFWYKVKLAWASPYALMNRKDIMRIYHLGRRLHHIHGAGDVAFFDLAEASVCNIYEWQMTGMHPKDTSEKGYLNTFNHITAQALITSIFSEELADYIADVHERYYMPEVITGQFSKEQLNDPVNNPMDNYVDIINNEWGQELGKVLKAKYGITRSTEWNPELLAGYLNDTQAYYQWALGIEFIPFRASDALVIRFSSKIKTVMSDLPKYFDPE